MSRELLLEHDPAMILAAAAELRMDRHQRATYRTTPIGHHAGRYLDELKFSNYSDKTYRNREDTLGLLALDYAHLQLDDVTTALLSDFLTEHWRDNAPNTRAQHVSSVKNFFRWAHDNDLIPNDPARRLRAPRAKDTDRRAHSEQTVRTLVVSQATLRDRVCILLLYWCALRRNELRLIQWRHVDLANRVLTVFGKGGTVLEQNLPEPLAIELERLILQRQPKPDHFVLYPQKLGRLGSWPFYLDDVIWEDPARPLTTSGIDKWWQRAVKRSGSPSSTARSPMSPR